MPLGGAVMMGASIAAPIIGGIIGNMASQGDRDRAAAAAAEAVSIIDKVGAPPDLSKAIIFEKFKQAGVLNPEMEQQINIGFSQVSKIQEDTKLRDAQINALEMYKTRQQGGLTPQDRAAFNEIRQKNQADVQGKLQQIQQNYASRGQGGSGSELASSLMASQGGANQASAEGDRIAATASQNALTALSQGGQLAGQIRGQDFSNAQVKANAADEFQRFQTTQNASMQQRNVGSTNAAQAANLQQAQKTQDTNTQVDNQEKLREVEAQRQYWQDQLSLATARAGARTGQVNQYQNSANATANMWSGIGSGAGQGASALGSYFNSQNKNAQGGGGQNLPASNDQYNSNYGVG